MEIKENIYYVGVLDEGLKTFDVIMNTKYGSSYNSYLVKGKNKVALIETVKSEFADEFIKIFPYPEFDITETEDIYSHINLNNDSIANPDDFIFTKPLEVIINDETFNKLSNWNKVLEEVFLYLYNSRFVDFVK